MGRGGNYTKRVNGAEQSEREREVASNAEKEKMGNARSKRRERFGEPSKK